MIDGMRLEDIDAMAAVSAVGATLRRIDQRLMDHGERVAFLACTLCMEGELQLDIKNLFLLSVFHDVGVYKTEEIDRMVEFETSEIWNHSIYGYLFLKHMTPLKDYAQAILYHHAPWQAMEESGVRYRDYAALIHLADRMDIAFAYGKDSPEQSSLLNGSEGLFRSDYTALAKRCMQEGRLLESLSDGSYRQKNRDLCSRFLSDTRETLEFLKMIVYSIDFRSEYTVTHTVNTVSIALCIARHFQLEQEIIEKIFLGSLLHDVGKIAIPVSILENPGRLSPEQMDIMRTHVAETRALIEGIVPQEICEIAVRHHEKLDGSGYPLGLNASQLTQSQRIVAVADIVSALSSRRSYKEPYPKEKTLQILNKMNGRQLDGEICDYVISHFDEIIERTEPSRTRVIEQYQSIQREYCELSAQVGNGKLILEHGTKERRSTGQH